MSLCNLRDLLIKIACAIFPRKICPSREIFYIDRQTGKKQIEKVYHEKALQLLYGDSWLSRLMSPWLLPSLTKSSWFSDVYGRRQKRPSSVRKIQPFIEKFGVNPSEFLEPVSQYRSFNDFFIRKLKPETRPLDRHPSTALIPADGRYYFYANIEQCSGFIVKGEKFKLETLVDNAALAKQFNAGSMAIARLCPSDYHRFHFPCDCLPGPTKIINGWLYSVNPMAVKKNIHILAQNKRSLCELRTPLFGPVLYIAIGATNVGSIKETYAPNEWQSKGAEKGYFEFGGSALILVFTKNSIEFDRDLLAATEEEIEMRCLFGQSMGKCSR